MPTWDEIRRTVESLIVEQKALANLVEDHHETCQETNLRVIHLEYIRDALEEMRGETVPEK